MKRIFDHIFAHYYSPLPIGSDEIFKKLQIWLNNPQCGPKEEHKFPIFGSDNHQGESSHMCSILRVHSNNSLCPSIPKFTDLICLVHQEPSRQKVASI